MKIFVSYRSVNRALVNELVSDLLDMEYEVWYDQALEGGQKWWDNILDNIRACDLLLFAMTPESLDSYPCQLEYTYANALKRHIIPVQISEGIHYQLLPVILQERQIINYVQRDKTAYKNLLGAIRSLPPAPALPSPLPEAPPIPISPLAPLKEQVDAPNLSYEQQVALLHQLKGYLSNTQYHADAHSLLIRLSQHPRLLASVLKDIEQALSINPPAAQSSQAPTYTPEPAVSESAPPEWLEAGEQLIHEALVSLFMGSGWASKRCYLTNRRIVLTPGPLGFLQKETVQFPLNEIASISKFMHNFINPAIKIRLKSQHEYLFLLDFGTGFGVGNRDEFIALIEKARQQGQ
jgi:TIR domain/GRAM domain